MSKLIFFITTLFLYSSISLASKNLNASRYELLTGVRLNKDEKNFWDRKYSRSKEYVYGKAPAKFLAANFHYIPKGAKVLDIGMGEGRNAVFLASRGYKVTGIDISSVAIRKARNLAREFGVRIKSVTASLDKYDFPQGSFDSIICFYYVDRKVHEKMLSWLKPGGVLIYEAHTTRQKEASNSSSPMDFYLAPGELPKMFDDLSILKYEEPIHLDEYTASIILRKPKA